MVVDAHGREGFSAAERYRSSVGGARFGPDGNQPSRLRALKVRLTITDVCAVIVSLAVGMGLTLRPASWESDHRAVLYGTPALLGLAWLTALALRGSYDEHVIGLGTEEIRRVISATLVTFAGIAGLNYLIDLDIPRVYALVSLPLGLVLVVSGRFYWRGWLYRRRSCGQLMNRTVLVGSGPGSSELQRRLARDAFAGYEVVALMPAPDASELPLDDWLDTLTDLIGHEGASAVAVGPSDTVTSEVVRQLAWRLEGVPVELLIAPAMLDIAGPRISVRPAAGLPLLHLREASLTRAQRVSKRALDLVVSAVLLIALLPVMALCAIAVRATSRGPVLFRQARVGWRGETITVLKFRTMVDGADAQRVQLREEHSLHEPMFKLNSDPRVTKVGKFLRRWSLDELPQLLNVLGGSMSVVGPRPHPLDDVRRYEVEAYRRLVLKPGLTGLWQVEGRSELSWGQALQMDLYYVENWTLSGDLVIMARTVRAVIQGRGAQ